MKYGNKELKIIELPTLLLLWLYWWIKEYLANYHGNAGLLLALWSFIQDYVGLWLY